MFRRNVGCRYFKPILKTVEFVTDQISEWWVNVEGEVAFDRVSEIIFTSLPRWHNKPRADVSLVISRRHINYTNCVGPNAELCAVVWLGRIYDDLIISFYILLTEHLGVILVNNQLDALFSMYLFHFSTCFEQTSAHHQEDQLYQYIIWYITL
jgi:hypothetical protein